MLHPSGYITDFPTINPARASLRSRFTYLASIVKGRRTFACGGILKVDREAARGGGGPEPEGAAEGLVAETVFGEGAFGGEAVFVPRVGPGAAGEGGEDDGYLATFVWHEAEAQSQLHLYDAKTLGLVCRLALRHRVPYGFHGIWMTGEEVRAQRAGCSSAPARGGDPVREPIIPEVKR